MNEQEISLSKLLYRIFREWRKCFIIALVGAIIIGAGNFVLKKMQFSNPEKLESAELVYERELAAFNAEGENLEREIENLEEMLEQQESYNEESILMQIDPFHKYNASVQFYVSTNYQIIPELTYQNIDLSSRILYSYFTYMWDGDMYQYIIEHLSEKIELRYLQEVFSVSADYGISMVTLSVQGVDEHFCQEVMSYAIEGIYSKQADIVETVGEHELSLLNRVVYETVDLDLNTRQKNNRQYVLDLNDDLGEKQSELAAWRRTSAPKKQYGLVTIVKSSIKRMILAFIVLAAFVIAIIVFRYIVSDEVQDAKDLKNRLGLRLIAEIPKVHKKRVWGWVDRIFAHMCGLTLAESDLERLTGVAAQSISAELAARTESGDKENPKIVFTGSIGEEELQKLLSGMKWDNSFSVSSASNILHDPSAVSAVQDADYVILVEQQEESRYSQIELELENLMAWKKEVLGVIVLGVDGIPA